MMYVGRWKLGFEQTASLGATSLEKLELELQHLREGVRNLCVVALIDFLLEEFAPGLEVVARMQINPGLVFPVQPRGDCAVLGPLQVHELHAVDEGDELGVGCLAFRSALKQLDIAVHLRQARLAEARLVCGWERVRNVCEALVEVAVLVIGEESDFLGEYQQTVRVWRDGRGLGEQAEPTLEEL